MRGSLVCWRIEERAGEVYKVYEVGKVYRVDKVYKGSVFLIILSTLYTFSFIYLHTLYTSNSFSFHKSKKISSRIFLNRSFHKTCPAKPYTFPPKSLAEPCAQPECIAALNDLSIFYSHEGFDFISNLIPCFRKSIIGDPFACSIFFIDQFNI